MYYYKTYIDLYSVGRKCQFNLLENQKCLCHCECDVSFQAVI